MAIPDPKPVVPKKEVLYITYAKTNELQVYDKPGGRCVNKVLLGSYLSVTDDVLYENEKWLEITTYGNDGWVKEKCTTKDKHLKIFFIDVGQGDSALLEIGNKRMLFDGGPSKDKNTKRYLYWQYGPIIKSNKQVKIDYVFISHFDEDHYGGLIDIIADKNFTFDTIFVAGLGKFKKGKKATTLGDKVNGLICSYFENLEDLKNKYIPEGQNIFIKFIKAVDKAKSEGRLANDIERLFIEDPNKKKFIFPINHTLNNKNFNIQVLGPIFKTSNGTKGFEYLKNSDSHTINGHSLVLKVIYGERKILFGGDLNTHAENNLLNFFGNNLDILEVDVAKSCHHGASEFTEEFMKKLNPYATIISSGDNEKYSHPRADAIGCAGKYSKSLRPLVFSTELARSTKIETSKIQYGMINLRCDGEHIYMAQKKEAKNISDPWDSYGPF